MTIDVVHDVIAVLDADEASLTAEQTTLQGQVDSLAVQIAALQAQLATNQAQLAQNAQELADIAAFRQVVTTIQAGQFAGSVLVPAGTPPTSAPEPLTSGITD